MLQKITGMMVGFWTFQELTECTDNDQRLPLLLPRDVCTSAIRMIGDVFAETLPARISRKQTSGNW